MIIVSPNCNKKKRTSFWLLSINQYTLAKTIYKNEFTRYSIKSSILKSLHDGTGSECCICCRKFNNCNCKINVGILLFFVWFWMSCLTCRERSGFFVRFINLTTSFDVFSPWKWNKIQSSLHFSIHYSEMYSITCLAYLHFNSISK